MQLVLIFVYPHSTYVQSAFFWNTWVRRILGLAYAGFLLTWIPFLRRRLFVPVKDSLLYDARLDDPDLDFYFDESLTGQRMSGRSGTTR